MLLKENRLTSEKDFDKVFKKGKIFFGPFFNIKILRNSFNIPRFGIIVSTKISKKAVIRNKVKRQLRSIVQKSIVKIGKNGYDIVILTKPAVTVTDFLKLEELFFYLLRKIGILR